MARTATATRKSIGLGFLPVESRHGFLIHIPKGSAKGDLIPTRDYHSLKPILPRRRKRELHRRVRDDA